MIVAVKNAKRLIFLLSLALAVSAAAWAQESYPSRSIRLVIDTSPGGVTDLFGRIVAEALAPRLGQTIYVDNKPGASGNVAADFLVRSAPDGYTLMIASGGGLVVKPFLERGLTFDVMNDLVPVFNVAEVAHILVVPASVPAANVAELIALAKAQPGKINYGSAGIGSPPHLSMELFAKIAGVKLTHVPYKGVGGAMPDLLAGRVQVMSMAIGSARPYLKTGQLRPLAAGAKHRLANLPDVPSAAEAGVAGWEMSAWFGIFAPRGTPGEIVRTLNEKLQATIDDLTVRQRFSDAGAETLGGSAESFAERYRADHRMWGQFIQETGIRTE
jgi:tripartite-type tricarboxylate transporter receptor subunit TctC